MAFLKLIPTFLALKISNLPIYLATLRATMHNAMEFGETGID
jgi:hypothetical protein